MFVIATLGCNVDGLDFENVEGPTWTPGPAIPIGYANYTIRELIEEINDTEIDLQEDSTTLLYMIYRDTADFNSGSEIINIDDVTNTARYDLTPAVGPATVTFNTTFEFTYEADNGEPVDSVFYSAGSLVANLTPSFSSGFTYSLTIDNTTNVSTGNPAVLTETQPTQDLTGHKTFLNRVGGLNTFTAAFEVTIDLQAGESLSASDFIDVTLTYQNQEFSLLYGKFGQDLLEVGNQTLNIQLFENLGNSGLEFGNPTLSFDFQNTFGLPLGIKFDGLYGLKDDDTLRLSGDITEDTLGVRILGAALPGTSSNTVIELNRSNSNIVDLLNSSPDQMGFNLNAWTNPDDPNEINYVEDDSEITTFIEMTLPMEVRLNDLTRRINFNLQGGLKFDEADSVTIRVVTVNEIPLYVLMDMEILDENDSVLYSVANNAIISTPFLNTDGSLKEARKAIEDIPLSKEGIEALNTGTKIRMTTLLNSPKSRTGNDIYVKILADYQIDIQVSIVGTLIIDL